MRVYAPHSSKGRATSGHDIHHKTADLPKSGAKKKAKRMRHAARQQAIIEVSFHTSDSLQNQIK